MTKKSKNSFARLPFSTVFPHWRYYNRIINRKDGKNMLCEKCKKKKAVIYYTENLYGELRSFNLCTECADSMRMSGELEEFSAAISGLTSEITEPPRALPNALTSVPIPK